MCTNCIAVHYFVHDKLQIIQQQHVLMYYSGFTAEQFVLFNL